VMLLDSDKLKIQCEDPNTGDWNNIQNSPWSRR
jgi:hypothetical protein